MGYLLDAFKASLVTLRQTRRATVTVEFPQVVRPRTERYRASFALVHEAAGPEGSPATEGGQGEEACIACKLCQQICPSDIITVTPGEKRVSPTTGKNRGYLADFTLDANACIYCELCVQVCPVDAIVMVAAAEVPSYAREDLVLTMDKLYANETQRRLSWANATKLWDMQDPTRTPPAPVATEAVVSVVPAVGNATESVAQARPVAPAPVENSEAP
ncbi:MAG: 4Fe-4S dicluster domain-containing protein [Myxococcales bacterium]|nr:4Fe-4S dicluster domain-containing protein [Myxococcales bacterium]